MMIVSSVGKASPLDESSHFSLMFLFAEGCLSAIKECFSAFMSLYRRILLKVSISIGCMNEQISMSSCEYLFFPMLYMDM